MRRRVLHRSGPATTRLFAPLLAPALLATLLGACSGAAPEPTAPGAASPAVGAASPGPGDRCPTAPAAPAELDGWPSPGMVATSSVYPVVISSEQVCGPGRFLFSFLDAQNRPRGAADRAATVAIFDLARDPATPTMTAAGRYLEAIAGMPGIYVADLDFPEAGTWGVEFRTTASGASETIRMRVDVVARGSAVRVGDPAPAVRTPTLADVGGDPARISSDPSPRPAFYETSIDAALAAREPFVLAFATPAFCTSAQCGPTLEIVKSVVDSLPGTLVINVEPYTVAWADGRLQPVLSSAGGLQPTEATERYGILTEPWIYVVDRDGIVRASFEGVLSAEELRAAIEAVR